MLDKLMNWFELVGMARAATILSQQGRYEEVEKLVRAATSK